MGGGGGARPVKPKASPEPKAWHVTRSGRVRLCFALDDSKREGHLVARGCQPGKMGCEVHPRGCPYEGYACGISTVEEARVIARAYEGQ